MTVLASLADALASGEVGVVDLTQPLSETTPLLHLPEPLANTPPFRLRELSRYDERGPAWYWNAFEGGEHNGTHFDAPIHWVTGRDGDDVSQVPPRRLVGPAVVIDKTAEAGKDPDFLLTIADVEAFEAEHGALPDGGWLLYRTGWDAGAAHAFDPPFPCHNFLLGADKYGLTQLANVGRLPPTGALVMAAPLKIVHGSGSPCRVLALVPGASPSR